MSTRTLFLVRLGAVADITLVSAVILWTRQSPTALLRTDSFAGAVGEVLFWGLPAFAVYLFFARTPLSIGTCSLLLLLMPWQWWVSATDWHSTASIGPGFVGWFLLPALLFVIGLAATLAQKPRHAART